MAQHLRRSASALMAVALALLSGCIFSPERKQPTSKPPIQYLAPISPQNVLENLVTSYMARDSIETILVYDKDYVGRSTDPSAPTPISQFTRAQEVSHVKRLHDDPNIVSVFLDLGSPGIWRLLEGNSSDPPGWAIIAIASQIVSIEDIAIGKTYESVDRVIEYTFKPTAVPGAPAPEDTTWTVVRWTELAN